MALTLVLAGGAIAADREEEHRGEAQPAEHRPEAYPGPSRYQRPTEPHGWNERPATVNREAYRHNFQASRSYKIGPYRPPRGWVAHHWVFGQILPRPYWAAEYIIADYWLFGFEVPPAGYEWVRDGSDALMISTQTGEILQVEYGVFG